MDCLLFDTEGSADAVRDQVDVALGYPKPGYYPDGTECPPGVGVTEHYADVMPKYDGSAWAYFVDDTSMPALTTDQRAQVQPLPDDWFPVAMI